MPLEVSIDVVPHGDESRRERLHTLRVTQVAQLDDHPQGWRRYAVSIDDVDQGVTVEHKRADGAYRLVQNVMARLGLEPGR